MQVRMKTHQTGFGVDRRFGEVYDVPDDEAVRMIAGGIAEPAEGVERAVVEEPAERAVEKPPVRKPRKKRATRKKA